MYISLFFSNIFFNIFEKCQYTLNFNIFVRRYIFWKLDAFPQGALSDTIGTIGPHKFSYCNCAQCIYCNLLERNYNVTPVDSV